jgi:chromosome segregation ATPase
MDDALEKVTAAMDEGAFDKFAEVIRALGVSTEETTENVEDLTGVLQERRSLEMQLLQAEGDIAGLRAMELEEIDESNRWIQERIWQLEDEAIASEEAARAAEEAAQIQERIASERAGLERQILELEGNTAAIRELELAALDESNRALQEHIWALEAEAAAAQEAARIAQERQGLQMEWYQLIGDTASIRAIEIEQIDESNRALQQQIWAKQDEMQAIEDLSRAVETARNNYRNQLTNQIAEAERRQSELEQSFSEAQSKLEQARQQQRQKETDSLNAQLSAQYDALSEAQAMADKWGAIADQLRDYQQSMLVGPESYLMPDQLLAEAQRQFYSGEAEDLPQLASTMLSAARNALTDPAEYRRLFGQVQNEIADQLALAEGKASEAERTANAAEAAIAQLEAQISATEQVETAVIDMDKALREYNEAKRALAQSSYNEQIKYYESELDRLDKMTGEIMSLEEAFDAYQQALTAAIETGYDELIANFGEELSALPQGISDSLYSVNQLGDGAADGYPTSLPVYVEGSTSDETLRTLLEALLIEVREDRELSRKIHRILDRASQGNDYIYTQAAS